MSWKKKLIVIVVVILGYIVIRNNQVFTIDSIKNDQKDEEQGIVTELSLVENKPMIQDLTYLGTLESETKALISPKVTGNIISINVSEGDIVKQGDVLVKIDTEQMEAKKETIQQKKNMIQETVSYLNSEISSYYSTSPLTSKIQSAKLLLDFQEIEVGKLRTLLEAGAISKSQLDQAEHQLETLKLQVQELEQTANSNYNKLLQERDVASAQLSEIEASIDELEISLKDSLVKAPFDGQITQIMVSVGELASPGRPLISLDDVHQLRIVTQVGESDLNKIYSGMKAEILLAGYDEIIEGEVSYTSGSVNPKTRIGEVRIKFSMDESLPIIGSSARVRILLDESRNEIMIPTESVKSLEDKNIVYIYDGKDRVYERDIKLGESINGEYHVIEGLAEGEIIAIRNIQSLSDGSLIYTLDKEEIK